MHRYVSSLLAAGLFLVACHSPSIGQATARRGPSVPPDNSVDSASYIALGLPAPEREWTAEDYSKAATALQKIAQTDVTRLPRSTSPKSASVFKRFVSAGNLSLATTPTLGLPQHLAATMGLLQGVNQVMSVYISASQRPTGVFDTEMVDLSCYVLDVVSVVIPLAEAYLASLPADDPSIQARRDGREQMRSGFSSIVSGFLTSLTEHSSYRTPELRRLSLALEASLPRIYAFLPLGVQQELPIRLGSMSAAESDPALKASLERLRVAATTLHPTHTTPRATVRN